MRHGTESWLAPIADMVHRGGGSGGFLLDLPDYRPDLVRAAAHGLNLAMFDIRAELLSPRGWDAHKVTLDELSQELQQRARDGGLVAHNAEALLATKGAAERSRWLEKFVERAWPSPIIVPLFLFGGDAPPSHDRRAALVAEELPEETLLGRLAFWGS